MPTSTEPDSAELASAVPIREVSRVTGVNSVTLRAWERRYGLLKPLRTDKGHRLYRPEDVARVEEIQSWLARGVAVSQVKALLGRPAPESGLESVPEDGPWEAFARRLQAAVGSLQGQSLDSLLAEVGSLYPTDIVVDQLLEPQLQALRVPLQQQRADYGMATRLAFLEAHLEAYFASALHRLQAANISHKNPRLLLMDVSRETDSVLPMILAYSLAVNSNRVDFFGPVPQSEWVFAVEQLGSEALILYSDGAPTRYLEQQRGEVEQRLQVPVWLAGRMTALCSPSEHPHCLGQTHRDILRALNTTDVRTRAEDPLFPGSGVSE
ncbi:MerR family transcriptional regulator [Marinimicrobium sp. C2-29]|uniref:MerR family transcriptional regulator n=1 Tax=Marinimicrobium sp. C2-29 TaxID=3139825 RepID=UPI0031388DEA